jgi:hypothetical protein
LLVTEDLKKDRCPDAYLSRRRRPDRPDCGLRQKKDGAMQLDQRKTSRRSEREMRAGFSPSAVQEISTALNAGFADRYALTDTPSM